MLSRRTVLRGAFAVGLGGAAAADPVPEPSTEPTGTIRPSATGTPRTKSDVYPRTPEQRPAGAFRGFDATCTHTLRLVDKVENRQIICPCHGSRFGIVEGNLEQGPALLPLPEQTITVDASGNISKGRGPT